MNNTEHELQDAHDSDSGIDLDFDADLDSDYYAQQDEFKADDILVRDEQLAQDDQRRDDDLRQAEQQRQDDQRREDDQKREDFDREQDRNREELTKQIEAQEALEAKNTAFMDKYHAELELRANFPDRASTANQQKAIRGMAEKDHLDLPENIKSFKHCRAWLDAHGELGKYDNIDKQHRGMEKAVEYQAAKGDKEAEEASNLFAEDRAIEANPEVIAKSVREMQVSEDSNKFYGSYSNIYGEQVSSRDMSAILAVNQCRKESSLFLAHDPERKAFQVSTMDDVRRFENWKINNTREYIELSKELDNKPAQSPIAQSTYESIVGMKTINPSTAVHELRVQDDRRQAETTKQAQEAQAKEEKRLADIAAQEQAAKDAEAARVKEARELVELKMAFAAKIIEIEDAKDAAKVAATPEQVAIATQQAQQQQSGQVQEAKPTQSTGRDFVADMKAFQVQANGGQTQEQSLKEAMESFAKQQQQQIELEQSKQRQNGMSLTR